MDIATLLGFLGAVGLVGYAIISEGNAAVFLSFNSLLIVLGGTFGATLINYPLKDVIRVLRVVKNAFVHKDKEYLHIIPEMIAYSRVVRKDGILAISRMLTDVEDQFTQEGLRLIMDRTPPETIRQIMRTEIDYLAARHRVGISIFNAMGNYAPAFGMIGTLIGLIFMLKSLNNAQSIASAMAVALITTFYGAILANILFYPLAGKLKERSTEEILTKEMILSGLMSIQEGEIPGMVEQRMVSFLPTEVRKNYFAEREW